MSVLTPAGSVGSLPSRGTVTTVAAVTVGSVLALAGIIGIALGAAFPLAVGIIEHQRLAISAADLALAERFASLSWAFVLAGVAALAAAFVVPALLLSRR
jgi:hypothetical protein